jgi:hypothetical protein
VLDDEQHLVVVRGFAAGVLRRKHLVERNMLKVSEKGIEDGADAGFQVEVMNVDGTI